MMQEAGVYVKAKAIQDVPWLNLKFELSVMQDLFGNLNGSSWPAEGHASKYSFQGFGVHLSTFF